MRHIRVSASGKCRECGSDDFGYDGEHMIKFCRACGTVEEKEFWHLME